MVVLKSKLVVAKLKQVKSKDIKFFKFKCKSINTIPKKLNFINVKIQRMPILGSKNMNLHGGMMETTCKP